MPTGAKSVSRGALHTSNSTIGHPELESVSRCHSTTQVTWDVSPTGTIQDLVCLSVYKDFTLFLLVILGKIPKRVRDDESCN